MKRFRPQKKNNRLTQSLVITGIVVASLAIVAIPGLREPLANSLSASMGYRSLALAVDTELEDMTQTRKDLLAKIEELEVENRELASENIKADIISLQNQALKTELGRAEEGEEMNVTLARVTARPPVSPYDTLMVDLGERDGVDKGDTVLSFDSIEIGTVSKVYESSARIKLYSSAEMRTPIEIDGQGALYVAEGQGGGEVTVNVPHSVEVEVGDTLTTPSAEPRIVADIRSVEASESEPFTLVRGRLPINIFELSWVLIEKK